MTCDSLTMTTGWRRRSAWRSSRWRRRPSARDRQRGRWAVVENLMKREQSQRSLPKNLIHPLPVQDRWGRRFQRPSLKITDARRRTGWSSLDGAAAEATKPRCVGVFMVVGFFTIFVVAAHIYRVTTSRNRLCLSLSKRIRHRLVTKINGKRRPQSCEALGRISMDYSCARHVHAPIASPRHAPPRPGEARRGEWARTRVCLPLSPLLHTLTSV
jgi:hypothetical protein